MRTTLTPHRPIPLPIDTSLLKPGLRLAVGLSGGADSVALLRALAAIRSEAGLVLHAAHLHHGLRGAEANGDLEFCRALAADLGLPFHESRIDTAAETAPNRQSGKASESIEEAARRLRYNWFRQLMTTGTVDAVATAHTLDDQAETVLGKFLRGAWTEGLSGIYPIVEFPEGRILRPLLSATRTEVEQYLNDLGQSWREDSSNRDPAYTRNRIRHELLPLLESWNPRLRSHLAQMAELARDEECFWQGELDKLATQLILPGRPVRGGGRAGADGLAIDLPGLAALVPAVQRRLLRHAARQLGAPPDFSATEALRELVLTGRAGQRRELANGLRAERSHRELRLTVNAAAPQSTEPPPEYIFTVPGEVLAPVFGLRLRVESSPAPTSESVPDIQAILRNWRPGDRVRLRYSSRPSKASDVLDRLKVTGDRRAQWPVLEINGRIVWMKGAELEPDAALNSAIVVTSSDLASDIDRSDLSG
jgi:tRNA(Ile)-lysidine synthase